MLWVARILIVMAAVATFRLFIWFVAVAHFYSIGPGHVILLIAYALALALFLENRPTVIARWFTVGIGVVGTIIGLLGAGGMLLMKGLTPGFLSWGEIFESMSTLFLNVLLIVSVIASGPSRHPTESRAPEGREK